MAKLSDPAHFATSCRCQSLAKGIMSPTASVTILHDHIRSNVSYPTLGRSRNVARWVALDETTRGTPRCRPITHQTTKIRATAPQTTKMPPGASAFWLPSCLSLARFIGARLEDKRLTLILPQCRRPLGRADRLGSDACGALPALPRLRERDWWSKP